MLKKYIEIPFNEKGSRTILLILKLISLDRSFSPREIRSYVETYRNSESIFIDVDEAAVPNIKQELDSFGAEFSILDEKPF